MAIKKCLNNDNVSLGILLAVIIPLPATVVFALLLRLLQKNLHALEGVKDINMLLLGMAVNLVIMRYYLLNLKFMKTGKALMMATVLMILLFFLFLKNSNFVIPF